MKQRKVHLGARGECECHDGPVTWTVIDHAHGFACHEHRTLEAARACAAKTARAYAKLGGGAFAMLAVVSRTAKQRAAGRAYYSPIGSPDITMCHPDGFRNCRPADSHDC